MGRIRTIKPEFPHSESMGKVSRDARLLFILMWTIADDEGRLRGCSRMLASLLFPYDDDAPKKVDGWVAELASERVVRRYVIDGSTYIQISKWSLHQKIDRPSQSRFPPFVEGSTKAREDSSGDWIRDQGPRTKEGTEDQGSGRGSEGEGEPERADARADSGEPAAEADKKPSKPKPVSRPEDVSEEVWADWLAHRRAKKATVTATVVKGFRREAEKAGVTLEQAMASNVTSGWVAFKAEWAAAGKNGSVGPKHYDGDFANKDYGKSGRL